MAITNFDGLVVYPNVPITSQAPNMDQNAATISLNGTSRIKIGIVVQVPKSGTLDGIELYSGFVSSPSAITASFQDVTSAGLPDGTLDQYRSLASPAAGWNVWDSMTDTGAGGGNRRTVTAGDWIAIVLQWTSTQSGQFWHYSVTNNGSAWQVAPRWITDTGAGFAASGQGNFSSIVLRYADGTYAPVGNPHTCWPFTTGTTHTFNSGSTPDERGVIWTPPLTVSVAGLWALFNASANCDFVLYDTDGSTPLTTLTLDADYVKGSGPLVTQLLFPAPITLTGGSTYRLVAKPGGSNVSLYSMTANAAAILAAVAGGTAMHGTSRTDAGAWTNTTTQRYWMGFLLAGVDTASGGGGGTGASAHAFVG